MSTSIPAGVAEKKGIAWLTREAERCGAVHITVDGKATATMLSPQRMMAIRDALLLGMETTLAVGIAQTPVRYTLDDLLDRYQIAREELAEGE